MINTLPYFSKSRERLVSLLDSAVWFAYLGLFIIVSFQTGSFVSSKWALIAAAVFGLAALHCLSAASGARANREGLRSSWLAALVSIVTLLLLLLQISLPLTNAAHDTLLNNVSHGLAVPSWYKPDVVWSVVPEKTKWLLFTEVLMLVLFLLTISLVNTRERVKQILFVVLAVGGIHALIAVFAKYAGVSFVDLSAVDGHFSVARGWFINRNHFASFVSLTSVGAFAFLFRDLFSVEKRNFLAIVITHIGSARLLLWVAVIGIVCAIVLSESRAGFFAILFTLSFAILVLANNKVSAIHRLYLLLLCAVVFSSILFYFGDDLLARLSNNSSFLGERQLQWQITWAAIEKEWLLGYGGNSYALIFQMERGYADLRQVVYDQAHSDYLHIWLEQGLVGLLLWCTLIAVVCIHAYRAFLHSKSRLVSAALIAILVVIPAALIQALVDFNLHIPSIRYYFFAILGLVYALPEVKHHKRVV